jgi:hypothetical protein
MNKTNAENKELIEAIRDLARIQLAVNGEFKSKSEIIRKLHSLSISPSRIALLLDMKLNDVTSAINKAKQATKVKKEKNSQ